MSQAGKSLFETLGGAKSIELMVADFYQSMLNDDELNSYYIENVNEISELHYLLTHFVVMIVGGPDNYNGRNLKEAHKNMPITQKHFDKVWLHMEASFIKHKVPP